jgi:outer membrane protein insertion porin family
MRVCRIVFLSLLLAVSGSLWAQQPAGNGVEVDYNNPKKYIVGGVKIEGTQYHSPDQILQIIALQKGMEVTVPSEDLSNIVSRLWLQRYF